MVIFGNQIPAWFVTPGRMRDLFCKCAACYGLLRCREQAYFCRRYVGGHHLPVGAGLVEPDQAILIGTRPSMGVWSLVSKSETDSLLSGGESRQIDDPFDIAGIARFGHHGATPRMPH